MCCVRVEFRELPRLANMAKKSSTEKSASQADDNENKQVQSDEEPNFSDPEDFVDDIDEEGTLLFLIILILFYTPVHLPHVYLRVHMGGKLSILIVLTTSEFSAT